MSYYPPEIPRNIEIRRQPLFALLDEAAERFPSQPATSFFGGELTFAALQGEANRFAHALIEMGIRPGERVAVHLPNCPQFLICLYGALKAGAIVTLASPLYEKRELAYQFGDAGVRALVTLSQQDILKKALGAAADAGVHDVIVTSIKDYFPAHLQALFTLFKEKKEGHRARLDAAKGQQWLKKALAGQPKGSPGIEVDPAATALLQYTGGTTGLPKGAELTHDNLVANARQARAWIHDLAEGGDSLLMVLPLFHVYALTCCNLAIANGCRQILLPRFDLPEVLKAISAERPTVFPGIPAMYAAINHSLAQSKPEAGKSDISSIRLCISGADKLPAEVQAEFERLSGGRLVEGYGLTEASPVTHVNPIHGLRRTGSIGLPLPNTETRITNLDTGENVEPGQEGELLVRGPQVMKGYWRSPEETAATITPDGWLRTGDIARADEDGFFFIVDRKKDVIITGGINVYPREVEEILSQFDKIREVAVKGIPHRLRGEIVKAYVVLKENQQATAADIRNFARERLAAHKVPSKIEFRRELPRSILRKVLKRKLEDDERKPPGT